MDQESTVLTEWIQAYMRRDDKVEPDIEGLQSGLSSKHRLKILTERYKGTSLFHKAIQLNHVTIVKLLLETLPPDDITTLSTIENKNKIYGYTPIHYTSLYNRYKILRDILKIVKEAGNSTLSFLQKTNPLHSHDYNVAHLAAIHDHWRVLQCMLDSLKTPEEKLQLITEQCITGDTVLCRAVCDEAKIQTVKVIVKHLSGDHLYQTMKIEYGFNGGTALHKASVYDGADIVSTLMKPLTPRQRLELLEMTDELERTPRDEAISRGHTETAERLRGLMTTALIDITNDEASNDEERQKTLHRLIESEDLSSDNIKELSPHSHQYIIPKIQGAAEQHAFIFYNSQDREGAHDEADVMEKAFTNIRFNVSRQEWKDVQEFESTIIESLEGITDNCSVVVICIMAHGKTGMITGENGSQLPINDILLKCTTQLPEYIPLVMIIQACQSLSTPDTTSGVTESKMDASKTNQAPAIDASKASPPDNEHIDLVRPHTLLVHATVMGGTAVRGALAGALCDKIDDATEEIDVLKMMTEVFRKISGQQTPIQQSTLQRSLVFPKPKQEADKRKRKVANDRQPTSDVTKKQKSDKNRRVLKRNIVTSKHLRGIFNRN